jgi:2,4-diaminopentanoate dehydrogenase
VTGRKYRIAQWGTGNVGMRALQAIIEHPNMELVALRVFSDAKTGKDAGELCGAARTGVRATQNIDDVIAAKPDCVIYLPDQPNIDDMCRLMQAGANIATACLGFNHRDSIEPDIRKRLEAACEKGRSSLYSTGSSPGWSTEMMPLMLMVTQRRIDSFTMTDYADVATRASPIMLKRLGFGLRPEQMPPDVTPPTLVSTTPSFHSLAEAIGLPLDAVEGTVEYALVRRRTPIAVGTLEAGTIGAIRMGVFGIRRNRRIFNRHSLWYVTRDLDSDWELKQSGWRMQVKGDTSLDVSIAFDVEPDDYARFSPGLTAHPVINVALLVIQARPGLLQTSDLPIVAPTLLDGADC